MAAAADPNSKKPPDKQSYSGTMTQVKTKWIDVSLFKTDHRATFGLEGEEIAGLIAGLGIPSNMVLSFDDSQKQNKKLMLEVDEALDMSEVRLHEAIIVKPGLRTRPLKEHAFKTYMNVFKIGVRDSDKSIMDLLSSFGDVIGIQYQKLSIKANSSERLKKLQNVRTENRIVLMRLKKFLPTFGWLEDKDGKGTKIKFTYNGQIKTCPRCWETVDACPGQGDRDLCARRMEEFDKPSVKDAWDWFVHQAESGEDDLNHVQGVIKARNAEIFSIPPGTSIDDMFSWFQKNNISVPIEKFVDSTNPKIKHIMDIDQDLMMEVMGMNQAVFVREDDGTGHRIRITAYDKPPEVPPFSDQDQEQQSSSQRVEEDDQKEEVPMILHQIQEPLQTTLQQTQLKFLAIQFQFQTQFQTQLLFQNLYLLQLPLQNLHLLQHVLQKLFLLRLRQKMLEPSQRNLQYLKFFLIF